MFILLTLLLALIACCQSKSVPISARQPSNREVSRDALLYVKNLGDDIRVFDTAKLLSDTSLLRYHASDNDPIPSPCSSNSECLQRGLPLLKPRNLHDNQRRADPVPSNGVYTKTFFCIGSSGSQVYTIPADGTYTITATGASGGDEPISGALGGSGAIGTYKGTFVTGQQVGAIVGCKGSNGNSNFAAGGGGSSTLFDGSTGTILVLGGGGGGAAQNRNGLTASTSNAGGSGEGNPGGLGGTLFNGGGTDQTDGTAGGGGGGTSGAGSSAASGGGKGGDLGTPGAAATGSNGVGMGGFGYPAGGSGGPKGGGGGGGSSGGGAGVNNAGRGAAAGGGGSTFSISGNPAVAGNQQSGSIVIFGPN